MITTTISDFRKDIKKNLDEVSENYETLIEADAKSDIDILVDLDYSQPIVLQFIQIKIDIEKLMGSDVDQVSSNGLSKYIKPSIDKEKQLIYAR